MRANEFLNLHNKTCSEITAGKNSIPLDSSFQDDLKCAFLNYNSGYISIVLRKLYYYCIEIHNIDLIKSSFDVLQSKAVEYSSDSDRLHNFKTEYNFMSVDPRHNLLGYVKKHLVSVMDVITGMKQNPSKQFILEHFGDVFNYGILLLGLIEDYRRMSYE